MIRALLVLLVLAFLCRAAGVVPAAVVQVAAEMVRALLALAVGLLRAAVRS